MKRLPFFLALVLIVSLGACGGSDTPATDTPTSAPPAAELPISKVDVGAIDATLASQGQQIFETRCTTCHKMDSRYVGPALGDVATRRSPEYVMNMVLAPEKMLQANEDARALLAEYGVPMTNQNLSQEEARAVLEYLRQVAEEAK